MVQSGNCRQAVCAGHVSERLSSLLGCCRICYRRLSACSFPKPGGLWLRVADAVGVLCPGTVRRRRSFFRIVFPPAVWSRALFWKHYGDMSGHLSLASLPFGICFRRWLVVIRRRAGSLAGHDRYHRYNRSHNATVRCKKRTSEGRDFRLVRDCAALESQAGRFILIE